MKRIIYISLSVILGLIFVFSAYVKLYPIELFELTFTDIGIANWYMAPYIARIMIAVEFLTGFLLILNLYFNKNTLKFTLGILIFFTLYLIYIIIVEGNSGNCKCFGNFISLTPLESIYKNIFLLLVTVILYKFHKGMDWKFKKIVFPIIIIIALSLPFILNPVDISSSDKIYNSEKLNYNLGLDALYDNPEVTEPETDLRKGKQIIAFMSLTCSHCRTGAYKLHILKKRSPGMPVFFVLNGDDENLEPFFDDTRAGDIPYTMLSGKDFIRLAGLKLPSIFLVNEGIVEKKLNYIQLDQKEIEAWLSKKQN